MHEPTQSHTRNVSSYFGMVSQICKMTFIIRHLSFELIYLSNESRKSISSSTRSNEVLLIKNVAEKYWHPSSIHFDLLLMAQPSIFSFLLQIYFRGYHTYIFGSTVEKPRLNKSISNQPMANFFFFLYSSRKWWFELTSNACNTNSKKTNGKNRNKIVFVSMKDMITFLTNQK